MTLRSLIALPLVAVLLVLATNHWKGWTGGRQWVHATDMLGYEKIMLESPQLPSEALLFHHAQRGMVPYFLGALSKGLSINVETLVWAVLLALYGLIASLLWRCLPLPHWGLSLAFLNPYFLRYYLLAPGLLPDVVFVAGMTLTLRALWLKRPMEWVFLGMVVATLGRQSSLAILPGVLWLTLTHAEHRRRTAATLVAFVVSLYWITGSWASLFAHPSQNLAHVLSLFTWMQGPEFSWALLIEHFARVTISLWIPLAVVVAYPKEQLTTALGLGLILVVAGLLAQPFLAGPLITGKNAARLGALSLVPMLMLVPWRKIQWPWAVMAAGGVGTFHHLYSWIGPSSSKSFAILQGALALGLLAWLKFAPQRKAA